MILHYANADITINVDPARLRPVDVPVIEADVSKLKGCTGWRTGDFIWKEQLRKPIEYWRKELA